MSSLPLQVDLTCKAAIISNAKLSYLERTYAMLEQQHEDLKQSYQTNKNMLHRALETLQAIQSGTETLDRYKEYAQGCQDTLQSKIQNLQQKLENQQQARKYEASKLLICQQIREEQALLHQQILNEYQAKILDLRLSIQEKQRHIQMLQSAEIDMCHPNQTLRLPSRDALKTIEEHNISQDIIQRLKEQNDILSRKLNEEQHKNKRLEKQLSILRINQPKQIYSSKFLDKTANTRCRSITNIKSKILVESQGSTQSSTDNQQKPKTKYNFKKNQSLLDSVVTLYKRQQLNGKIMHKKMKQVHNQFIDMVANQQLLIESNKKLTTELVNLKKVLKTREIRKPERSARSCQKQAINSDKTFDRLFFERKQRVQARKIELQLLKSMFRERVRIMESQIMSGSFVKKDAKSSSWSELPESEFPTETNLKQDNNDVSLLIDGDFSRIMQEPVKCAKPITFAEFFGQTAKNVSFLDIFVKDE